MTYTPGQVCDNCGNDSPRARVSDGCEQAQRSFEAGAAAERARLVAVVRRERDTYDSGFGTWNALDALARVLEAMGAEEGSGQ